jgi:hypothetical protein
MLGSVFAERHERAPDLLKIRAHAFGEVVHGKRNDETRMANGE